MRAIHMSVRVAPVRGTLIHGDHGNELCLLKFFIIIIIIIKRVVCVSAGAHGDLAERAGH